MRRFYRRLLLVSISFPLFFVFLVLIPQYNHLAFNLVVVAITCLGAFELEMFFRRKKIPTFGFLAPILGAFIPLVTYFEIIGVLWTNASYSCIAASITIVLVRACFVRRKEDLAPVLNTVASSVFIVLYPGILTSYVVRLAQFEDSSLLLLLFFSLVFGNDILAYVAGNAAGKGRVLGVPASPQKTAVGFAVGFCSSILISVVYYLFVPSIFGSLLIWSIVLGSIVGLSTIIGDLVESAMKRSALVKDSGTIIPGRGGVLDSIDSMLISAPVFYFFFTAIL